MRHAGRRDVHRAAGDGDEAGLVEGRAEPDVERARQHGRVARVGMGVRRDSTAAGELDPQQVRPGPALGADHPDGLQAGEVRRALPAQAVGEEGFGRVAPSDREGGAAADQPESRDEALHGGPP